MFDASRYAGTRGPWHSYDVSNDDQRFVMIRVQPTSPRLILHQNFFEEIRRRTAN